jgi:hypothetical protein
MKYIITKTEPFRPYFGMGDHDPTMYCRDLYTLFDLSCIEIAEPLFDTIYPLIPAGYEEITEDEAKYGSWFFSEVKDEVKVLDVNLGWADTLAIPESAKVLFTLTDEIKAHVIQFMYRFAKEIIETEYNERFRKLNNTTELEKASWSIQKHEAKEWLTYQGADGHVTPFLDYLSTERGIDKTVLSNKILEKAESYEDNLSTLLVKYQTLLKEFEVCTTVREINVLYEKYFGIMVPALQAREMGLADDDGARIYTVDDQTYYDVNNPRFGNKLNF